jgi:hypothetical protein
MEAMGSGEAVETRYDSGGVFDLPGPRAGDVHLFLSSGFMA